MVPADVAGSVQDWPCPSFSFLVHSIMEVRSVNPKRLAMALGTVLTVFGLGLISVSPVSAETWEYSQGGRSISVNTSVSSPASVTYRSARGTLRCRMSSARGLETSNFRVFSRRLRSGKDFAVYEVEVWSGSRHEVGTMETELATGSVTTSANWDRIERLIADFDNSFEGSMLQELSEWLIDVGLARHSSGLALPPLESSGNPRLLDDTGHETRRQKPSGIFDCAGAVLNGIAASAAGIAGCATPACGPYWHWCCLSGVAWYASSLIQIAHACEF